MKTYNITSEQVSMIHNAYCYASYAYDLLQEQVKEDSRVLRELKAALDSLKPVRDDVTSRKNADWEENYNTAKRIADLNGFEHSVWSIYDIDGFDSMSGIPVGSQLRSWYSGKVFTVTVEGPTWLDLWKATNSLIKQTADLHGNHIFIEGYREVKGEEGTFEVSLGS